MLLAYRDEALSPEMTQKVREGLDASPELLSSYEALLVQEAMLYDLGRALREVAPAVDMCDAVMEQVQRIQQEEDPLVVQLRHVGDDLRAAAPTLDIAGDVMQAIAAQRQASMTTLKEELIATGEEIRALAPRVEIVEEVMEEVASGRLDNVTSFEAAKRAQTTHRRQSGPSWAFIAAAAACVIAVLGFVVIQMAQPHLLQGSHVAQREQTGSEQISRENDAPKTVRTREGEPREFKQVSTEEKITLLSPATDPPAKENPRDEQGDLRLAVDVDTIIAARRDALAGKSDAVSRLARWGALDPDQVRRFLAEGILSPKDLAGLSRFLPEAEARALLQEAVAKLPDDPMLHFALAKNLMSDPEQYDAALNELARFRELTPDNSLSYYMDAQIRLAQGDYTGALQSIDYASSFQTGSAYALENAQYHSAALRAAGFPDDVAQMLAAFNAGSAEYGFVTQLGSDLLSYGAYYESIGDYDTAMAIYKGVNQLGLQVNQGADFSNEMLAGLDTQRGAIEAIDALAELMDIPGGAYTVEIAYTVFMQGMDFFLEYTSVFENMIGDAEAENILRTVQQIMQVGDLHYMNKP
jgi:tetratricopeptide (TPR) repeat protein